MTICKDRNKDRFENWQLCGVWKLVLPFCDHRAIKLTQNCFSFANPCINLLAPPSATRKYATPRCLNVSTCCSVLPLTCSIHCLGFVERRNTSVFLVLISFRRGRTQLKTDRVHSEDSVEKMLAVPNRLQQANGWSCSSKLRHPHLLGYDWLCNSCRPRLHNTRSAKAFLAARESFLNCRKCCKSSTSNK